MSSCSIIAIGNELTRGKITDTNSTYIAAALHRAGITGTRISLIEDDLESISKELLHQAERADWIITTGGLGPTTDDLTRNAIAAAAGVELVLDDASYAKLEELCRRRNRPVNENNRRQAYYPHGARVLVNGLGTADGFCTTLTLASGKSVPVFSVPGVPKEMKALIDEQIIPWATAQFKDLVPPLISEFRVFGLAEAHIGEIIEKVKLPPSVEVGYRPQFPEILVQLTARVDEPDPELRCSAEHLQTYAEQAIAALGEEYILARKDGISLASVVAELLRQKRKTICAAESCSGGKFADALVSIPGSSAYFLSSAVVYSNKAKRLLIDVPREILAQHGAVSEQCAVAMAAGAREAAGADIAVSITGIAGPDGGSAEKPVGLIWVGFAAEGIASAHRLLLPWDREFNRVFSAAKALDLVRRHLLGLELK